MIAGATVVASTGRSRPPRPPVAGAVGLSPGGDQPMIEKVCFKNWLRVLGRVRGVV